MTKLKIEHFERSDIQMRTYLITEADGKQDFCYEGDGDYKAIRYLQRCLAESNQLQELLVAKAAANYDEQQKRISQLEYCLQDCANCCDMEEGYEPYDTAMELLGKRPAKEQG